MMHDACGFMTHECTRSIWQGKVMHESRPSTVGLSPPRAEFNTPFVQEGHSTPLTRHTTNPVAGR
jgi:hypothetical protein